MNNRDLQMLHMPIQMVGNATIEVARAVANITSDAEQLTAADISVTSFVVDQLTTEAIENPEVCGSLRRSIHNVHVLLPVCSIIYY